MEKPQDRATQDKFKSRDDPERPLLGSMGIYLFNVEVLEQILTYHPRHDDFGINIIPEAVHSHTVYGFEYDGYWRDIGTIRAYYETNLQLTLPEAPFSFYDPRLPIYTLEDYLPGSIVQDSTLNQVLLADGCWIEKAEVSHSVVGLRSQIGSGTHLKDTIINGSDYYAPEIGIAPNCSIQGAIIDKNARIGEGVVIQSFPPGTDLDREGWVVRDGIVVLQKDAQIAAGTRIAPDA